MPNILLIDTNTTPFNEAYPVYPIGLDYLQGTLKQAGFSNTHILDLRQVGGDLNTFSQREKKRLEAIAQKVKERRWDVIGTSIRNIDSTYPPDPANPSLHYYLPQIKAYIDCIEAANTKAHIILGGSGFSMMPEEILDYIGGNYYGVAGKAEAVLPQIIAHLLDNKLQERVYKAISGTKIGKLQNLALLENYKTLPQTLSTVGIRTKNGCGQHCGYCPYPSISGSDIITKAIPDILDEIRILRHEVGFTSFMFADDIFNASLEHAKQILKAMLSAQEIPESWHAYLNPKDIDQELLELIVETNGWSYYSVNREKRTMVFSFDIDSGCNQILTNMGKGFTTEDIKRSLATFDRVKRGYEQRAEITLNTVFHLLLGYLGEDEESIKESCQFLNETLPNRILLQLGVRIYPHTPLAQQTKGVLWQEPKDLLEPTFVPFNKAEIKTWLGRYLSPCYRLVSEAGNMIQLVKEKRRESKRLERPPMRSSPPRYYSPNCLLNVLSG